MKKIFFVVACMSLSWLYSCSEKLCVLNFYNCNGGLLWTTKVKKGIDKVTYMGPKPRRPQDEMYEYVFSGWNESLNNVQKDTDYYAQYDKKFRTFIVTYNNYDGRLIKQSFISYGQNASINAPKPTRENETRAHYYFSHWESESDLTYVTSNITCTAVYSEIECFEVRYYDYDDTLLNVEYVEKGKDSSYDYNETRDADGDHLYVFNGWSKPVINVQEDMSVVATYSLVDAYTVTFADYNGAILGKDKGPAGFTAQYNGKVPVRYPTTSGDYTYYYTFIGWDKNLENVRSSFTTTAQYSVRSYNGKYADLIAQIRRDLHQQGGMTEDGYYSFVFYLGSDSGYLYTGLLRAYGYGKLELVMAQVKSDSSGSKAVSVTLYLPNEYNNGKYSFDYQFVRKDSSGRTTGEDGGYGTIYGPTFSSQATLSFDSYWGEMPENYSRDMAKYMLSIDLDRFAKSTTYSMKTLGFDNYDY